MRRKKSVCQTVRREALPYVVNGNCVLTIRAYVRQNQMVGCRCTVQFHHLDRALEDRIRSALGAAGLRGTYSPHRTRAVEHADLSAVVSNELRRAWGIIERHCSRWSDEQRAARFAASALTELKGDL